LAPRSSRPVSTLKSRGERLGVQLDDAITRPDVLSGYEDERESFGDQLVEFVSTLGYGGAPAQRGMLQFAQDLGLDHTTMFKLAHKASELAGDEHNRIIKALWTFLDTEWYGRTTDVDDEAEESWS
jgi:hypothetical protein